MVIINKEIILQDPNIADSKGGVELATQNAQPLWILDNMIRIYKGETP
jgi:hypothetical protein